MLALDSVESKFGGGKADPSKMRSTNEKITDGVREQFEKATGLVPRRQQMMILDADYFDSKKVPSKFSN